MKAPSGIYSSPDARGKYKATGEFREPRRGEFYLSGAIVEAYRAPNDLSTKYWIAVKAAAAAPMHRAEWQPLPQAAKDALRRELARVGETNEEKEERIAAAFGMRGPAAQREFDAAMTAGDAEPEEPANPLAEVADYIERHGTDTEPPAWLQEIEPASRLPIVKGDEWQGDTAQLSPAPGTFVDLLRPDAVGFVDITPEVLKTPEGCARVNQAMKEFEDATANVANAAEEYVRHYYQGDCITALNDLRDAIATRRAKQEAFLRAMANQPPQSDEETFERQGVTITKGRKMTSYDKS